MLDLILLRKLIFMKRSHGILILALFILPMIAARAYAFSLASDFSADAFCPQEGPDTLDRGPVGKTPPGEDGQRPNILLIVSEDNGPDIGCYGASMVKTPVLDHLARKGVRFDNAFVTYPVCSPSRGTIFTGLYPHQNGQIGLATHKYRMYPGIVTLPAYLKQAGYRTGCIGKIHVNPESAIPFDFRPPKGSFLLKGNFQRRNLPLYAALADSFFRKSETPFFLMVNYPDAHTPWKHQVDGMPSHPLGAADITHPPAFVGTNSDRLRALTADYYNSMERLDEMIGELLKNLKASGKAQNTVIIYMGDHGPEFSRGKFSSYEAGLKVPLIVYWPDVTQAGGVRSEFVSSVDILPTILDAARVDKPQQLPGTSLHPLLADGSYTDWQRQYVFADNEGSFPFGYYPRNSVRGKRYKLIHNLLYQRENPVVKLYTDHLIDGFEAGSSPGEIGSADSQVRQAYATWRHPPEYELYDLKEDPHEFHNLSGNPRYLPELNRLKAVLHAWQVRTIDPMADSSMLNRLTSEVDEVVRTHPKMDDAKDNSFSWHYPDYFFNYINEQKALRKER